MLIRFLNGWKEYEVLSSVELDTYGTACPPNMSELSKLHHEFIFVPADSNTKYNEEAIICMLNFLIDNIFVVFGGTLFQQTIGIPMGTNCAPLYWQICSYILSRIRLEAIV